MLTYLLFQHWRTGMFFCVLTIAEAKKKKLISIICISLPVLHNFFRIMVYYLQR
jgi:hypothetical protein